MKKIRVNSRVKLKSCPQLAGNIDYIYNSGRFKDAPLLVSLDSGKKLRMSAHELRIV